MNPTDTALINSQATFRPHVATREAAKGTAIALDSMNIPFEFWPSPLSSDEARLMVNEKLYAFSFPDSETLVIKGLFSATGRNKTFAVAPGGLDFNEIANQLK